MFFNTTSKLKLRSRESEKYVKTIAENFFKSSNDNEGTKGKSN